MYLGVGFGVDGGKDQWTCRLMSPRLISNEIKCMVPVVGCWIMDSSPMCALPYKKLVVRYDEISCDMRKAKLAHDHEIFHV